MRELVVFARGRFGSKHPKRIDPKGRAQGEPQQGQGSQDEAKNACPGLPLEKAPCQGQMQQAKETQENTQREQATRQERIEAPARPERPGIRAHPPAKPGEKRAAKSINQATPISG